MTRLGSIVLALSLLLLAAPLAAYTVYLKDGSKIVAKEPYVIEGDKAIITLQNGTRTSIDAAEIDTEKTRAANQSNYGSALVLEDGKFTEMPAKDKPPKKETLADLISRREAEASERPRESRTAPSERRAVTDSSRPTTDDFRTLGRTAFRNMDLAIEVQRVFRAQGVEEVLIYQGSRPGNMLLDVTANSEASVFRTLEVAAEALLHAHKTHPEEKVGFELILSTAERERGGQFLIDAEAARQLAGKEVEVSAFFIDNVLF